MCAEHEACHEAAWQAQSLRVQTSARLLGLWVAQALPPWKTGDSLSMSGSKGLNGQTWGTQVRTSPKIQDSCSCIDLVQPCSYLSWK
jgi:hypothetical protein